VTAKYDKVTKAHSQACGYKSVHRVAAATKQPPDGDFEGFCQNNVGKDTEHTYPLRTKLSRRV
jgi:hypothetical protein